MQKTLILLIFGLFLGCSTLVQQRKKTGLWRINKGKICLWGISSFLVTLFVNIVHMGLQILITLPIQATYISNTRGFFFQFSVILLGFTIMNLFYKETEKTEGPFLELFNRESINEDFLIHALSNRGVPQLEDDECGWDASAILRYTMPENPHLHVPIFWGIAFVAKMR